MERAIELAGQLRSSFEQEYGDPKPSALVISGIPEQFLPLTDELCLAYSTGSVEDCQQVRQIISENRMLQGCFLGNVIRASRALRSASDSTWLQIGLASASLEDCCQDYRDDLMALAELYVCAEKADLDARKAFQDMAVRSNSERPRGGSEAMRNMLDRFDSFAVLAERRAMSKSYFPLS